MSTTVLVPAAEPAMQSRPPRSHRSRENRMVLPDCRRPCTERGDARTRSPADTGRGHGLTASRATVNTRAAPAP